MKNYRFKSAVAITIIGIKYLYLSDSYDSRTIAIFAFLFYVSFLLISKEIVFFLNIKKQGLASPRFPRFSNFLSQHELWFFVIDQLHFFVCIKLIYPFISDFNFWKKTLIIGVVAVACQILLANNVLRLIKQIAAYRFNIVIFRRFSDMNSSAVKKVIAPILGGYANITSVWDSSLQKTKYGSSPYSEEVLGESSASIHLNELTWKNDIKALIENSDCVVFFWFERPTDNMIFEYKTAQGILSSDRILFIAHAELVPLIRDELGITELIIEATKADIDEPNPLKAQKRIRRQILEFMQRIE